MDTPYVLYDPSGRPYNNVKRRLKKALRNARIDDFKFHALRHAFVSHLVMAGAHLNTVKDLLGHKDIEMTLRYAHLAPAHELRAVEILDKVTNDKVSSSRLLHSPAVNG